MTILQLVLVVLSQLTLCLLAYFFGTLSRAERTVPMTAPVLHWQTLPSGWSKNNGTLYGYAIFSEGNYYWWVRRGEKTIIEGPARTLELAQYEVEAAMHELTRGA